MVHQELKVKLHHKMFISNKMLFMNRSTTILCVPKAKNVIYITIKVKVDRACNLRNKGCRERNEQIKTNTFFKYKSNYILN